MLDRLLRIAPIFLVPLVSSCAQDPFTPSETQDCSSPDVSGCWRSLSAAPERRQELQPAELDGRIYVAGGLRGTSFDDAQPLASVDVYDPASNSWSTVAPLPEARHHVALASVDGRLYAIGGMTGGRPAEWTEHASTSVYDPRTDTWTSAAPMPTPRGEHLAFAYGGKIYVIGGRDRGMDSDANEVYDPAIDSWTTGAPMPTPRRSFAAAVLDSLIYVAGGRVLSPTSGTLTTTDVVEAYSPESDRWYSKGNLTTGRGGLALGSLNGRLYAMGGENLAGGGSVYSVNREFNAVTNSWRLVRSIPVPVHGTGAVTVGTSIYLLAGAVRAGVYSSDVAQAFTITTS